MRSKFEKVSDRQGNVSEWTLADACGDREIYRGDLRGACGSLLADDTATLQQHGLRTYWLHCYDRASAQVLNLGREFYVFSVVGPREGLQELSDEIRQVLISEGGIPS